MSATQTSWTMREGVCGICDNWGCDYCQGQGTVEPVRRARGRALVSSVPPPSTRLSNAASAFHRRLEDRKDAVKSMADGLVDVHLELTAYAAANPDLAPEMGELQDMFSHANKVDFVETMVPNRPTFRQCR